MKRQTWWWSDTFVENVVFGIFISICIGILIGMALLLGRAHSSEQNSCLNAGYEWSATKYVCVVNLKK